MKPIPFEEQNSVYAEDQPEYLPLPVHKTEDGRVISCWGLSFWERIKVLFRGKVWLHVSTFNSPLQPLYTSTDSPFEETE